MKFQRSFTLASVIVGCMTLAACGDANEFPPQTADAYLADDAMRADILARCAKHVADKTPFRSQSDTAECAKAKEADFQKSWHKPVRLGESKAY